MWRVLIVLGLTVATVGGAEARGFRSSFRPRMTVSSRPFIRSVERKASALILRENERPPTASVLDAPRPVIGQAASPTAPANPKADQAAHWCDNGKLVGSGAGFCVLDVSAGAPS